MHAIVIGFVLSPIFVSIQIETFQPAWHPRVAILSYVLVKHKKKKKKIVK